MHTSHSSVPHLKTRLMAGLECIFCVYLLSLVKLSLTDESIRMNHNACMRANNMVWLCPSQITIVSDKNKETHTDEWATQLILFCLNILILSSTWQWYFSAVSRISSCYFTPSSGKKGALSYWLTRRVKYSYFLENNKALPHSPFQLHATNYYDYITVYWKR